jgi:hypothetical protein
MRQLHLKIFYNFKKNDITFYPVYLNLTDLTTLDAKIIHGEEFGNLYEPLTNTTGKEIQNIQSNSNHLLFIPQNVNSTIEDSVVIMISAANPAFAPQKVVLKIEPEKLQVTFVPSVISAGDVANIIVKKKNDNGTLSDLPSDQLFNVRIVDGVDYGGILVPGYNDTTTERSYVRQGFSFYAKKQIPLNSVTSSVYVETTQQAVAESIIPGKPSLNKKQTPIQKSITPQSILQKNSLLKSNLVIKPNISYKSSATKSVKQVSSVNSTQDDGTLFGTGTVTINSEGLLVNFDKPTFNPGDTLNVIIKRVDSYGNETDYPDTTQFEVGIQSGCDLGVILNSVKDTTAQYFAKIRQPIKFIASKSINPDSEVVLIVGAPDIVENQNQAKISNGKSGTLLKKNANNSNITSLQTVKKMKKTSGPGQECLFFQMLHSLFGTTSATVNKLEIIYPLPTSANELITSDPQMPNVTCKAKLHNYSGGQVKYEWEYWISNDIKRFDNDGNPISDRTCKIEIVGKSNSINAIETQWKVPFSKDSIKSFQLIAPVPQIQSNPDYGGNDKKEINIWQDDNDIFTGGNVWVKVTAFDKSHNKICENSISANKILGLDQNSLPSNPTSNAILAFSPSNEIKAIILVESRNMQFKNDGYPNYGPPNGFGLMQIDNYTGDNGQQQGASEKELWNWKANILRADSIFIGEKYNLAKGDFKSHKSTPPSNDELLMENFARYNGGNYYRWDDDENCWKRKPLNKFPNYTLVKVNGIVMTYAERVWEVYNNLK